MKRLLSITVFFVAVWTTPAAAQIDVTGQGRWSLGGSASFPFEYNKYRLSSFGFSLKPEASYFVMDGLELAFGIRFANILAQGELEPPRMQAPNHLYWGFQLGLHYFVQCGSTVQPYIGLDFGVTMNEWQLQQAVWFVEAPIGIAWFVNPNMAINFAIPISVNFSSTALFEKLEISPGYLGVKAFF